MFSSMISYSLGVFFFIHFMHFGYGGKYGSPSILESSLPPDWMGGKSKPPIMFSGEVSVYTDTTHKCFAISKS